MKVVLALFILFFHFSAPAEETVASTEKLWAVLGGYSSFDTWLPGKLGATGVYGNSERTYELSLQQTTYGFDFLIDGLGQITDRRIHLTTRSFKGSSFNWQYGVSYNSLNASLGSDYTDAVGGRYDAVNINTLGLMWGFGNRWSWENGFTVGVDWFRIFQPVFLLNTDAQIIDQLSAGRDKDDLQKFVDSVASLPTFSVLSFELGYSF